MKSRNPSHRLLWRAAKMCGPAWLCLGLGSTVSFAQSAIVGVPSIPEDQIIPPAPQTPTSPTPTGTAAPPINPNRVPSQPLQWGPVVFYPDLNYQFFFATGILSQPGQPQDTFMNLISPGLAATIGSHWKLEYIPTLSFYSDPAFQNSFDQNILLSGKTQYEDWTYNFKQSCSLTKDVQVQTAQQTEEQNYITTVGAQYELNDSTFWDFRANQSLLFLHNLPGSVGNSLDWLGFSSLNYRWAPNFSAGGGIGAGYNPVEFGANMIYQQVQANLTWKIAHKLDLVANGGVEFRQFLDSTQPQLISPISAVTLNYRPFEGTSLSFNSSRDVSAAYYENLATQTTSINATLLQRALNWLTLGVSGGYFATSYHSTGAPGVNFAYAGRMDKLTSIGASLNTPFLKHGTASAYYTYSHNSSNEAGFSYTSNQVGFQLSYRY